MALRNSTIRKRSFEWIYLFIIVIYMGQATPETSRMVMSLSGNPIPFFIPIILTTILCFKHQVSFRNRKFQIIVLIYIVWMCCSLAKYKVYTTQEISYHFFMLYAITLAYIHAQVYGKKIVPWYEDIMTLLCKIAITGWLVAVLVPASASFFRIFQETNFGNNVFYLFTWMDPAKGQVYDGITRNAGCSWEPGRFAIMVALSIFCNLCRNGIRFRNNKNIWWFLIAIASTQSTTGFIAVMLIYLLFYFQKVTVNKSIVFAIFVVPLFFALLQLDFMNKKISMKLNEAQNVERMEETWKWQNKIIEEGEYSFSVDRFDAMVFEWMNFVNDPLLGYGRNFEHSFFYNNISSNASLANGLVKILANYGFLLGLLFFYILYESSKRVGRDFCAPRIALFILFVVFAVSYQILSVPIFTAFWFYGLFTPKKIERTA